MDGILSLKWNNHLTVLFNTLSSLYKKDLYSDVTIACGGRFFPVHKLVLSACSDFFEELFRQTPCTHPVVIIKDVSVNDLEALLSYMYLGEANVAQTDLARLIKAAECLCIKGLAVPDEGSSDGSSAKRRHTSTDESTRKRRKSETKNPPPATASPAKSSTPPAPTEGERGEARLGGGSGGGGGGGSSSSSSSNSSGGGSNPPTRPTPPPAPPSPREDSVGSLVAHTHATQNLAEVVLEDDDPIIKEEVELPDPKCEAEVEVEEVVLEEEGGRENNSDENISRPGGSRMFASPSLNSSDGAGDGASGDGGGGSVSIYDPQTQALAATHPNSGVLTDLMVSGIAGPSVPGDIGWESMGGFPLEALQSEDSRSSQPLRVVSVVSQSKLLEPSRKKLRKKRKKMNWWRKKPNHRAASFFKMECGERLWSVKGMKLWRRAEHTPPPPSPSSPPSPPSPPSDYQDYLGSGTGTGSPSVVEEAAAAAAVTLSCPYCQRTFTYRSDLNRHVRSHTGEKPYTCTHCDYRATQKTHLNEHIKRRHQHLI